MHLARLPVEIHDGEVWPSFLGEGDLSWLRALLELASAHSGAPWRELQASMSRPVSEPDAGKRQALAAVVLGRMFRRRIDAAVSPSRVREVVFGLAAGGGERDRIIAAAAEQLALDPRAVEKAMFADLPAERVVVAPDPMPTAAELAVKANLEMCRALLMRAVEVEIQVVGRSRVLARRAHRRGLLCTVAAGDPETVCLTLTGPLSLFRRTTRYGHALGALLPALGECDRFDLIAALVLGEREVELRLRTGDPFLSASGEDRRARSVEERLARELDGQEDWVVIREPEPIESGSSLLFPDFELVSRRDTGCRWLIEIVGFWTPPYLERKRAAYRQAGLEQLVLCVDDRLKCADGAATPSAEVIRFRGAVPVEEIWRLLSGAIPTPTSGRIVDA